MGTRRSRLAELTQRGSTDGNEFLSFTGNGIVEVSVDGRLAECCDNSCFHGRASIISRSKDTVTFYSKGPDEWPLSISPLIANWLFGDSQLTEIHVYQIGMRRPVSAGCDTLPMIDVLEALK